MVRETNSPEPNSIYPMFIVHGRDVREEIWPMPGVYHLSVDQLVHEVSELASLKYPAIVLFLGCQPTRTRSAARILRNMASSSRR